MVDQFIEHRDLLMNPHNRLDSHLRLVIPNRHHHNQPNQWNSHLQPGIPNQHHHNQLNQWLNYRKHLPLNLNISRNNQLSQSANLNRHRRVNHNSHKSHSFRKLTLSVKLPLQRLKVTKYYLHPASLKFTLLNLNLVTAWFINRSMNQYRVYNPELGQSWQWPRQLLLLARVNQWWPFQHMDPFINKFNNNQVKWLPIPHNTVQLDHHLHNILRIRCILRRKLRCLRSSLCHRVC